MRLLTVNAVWGQGGPPAASGAPGEKPSLAPASAGLVATMAVARDGDRATYSIMLRNPGDAEVKDIFVAGTIAPGTTFLDAGENAAKAGFKAVEGNAAVWLSPVVPPRGWGGPFVYRVKLTGDIADPVQAWVHWRVPVEGTALSSPIRVLPSVTSSTLLTVPFSGRVTAEPLIWQLVAVVEGAQLALPAPDGHGAALTYMLDGVETLDVGGVITSHGPGGAFFHSTPHVHINRNDSPNRYLTVMVSPASARGQPFGPGISLLYESEELTGLADGPYTLILGLSESQPGGSSPTHYHPGPTLVHVLEGYIANNLENGTLVYGPGGSFVEQARELNSQLRLAPTKLLFARLVPTGVPATVFTTEARPHPWNTR